ncbi:Uncharacterised protein at_DN2520 [Pycnogonum litorale]
MFDRKNCGKIKNDKILRWRTELSCYDYDIKYRPGKQNFTADCLSRTICASSFDSLQQLHSALCHPGVTRMWHFVRTKNLPHSLADIKQATAQCRLCAQVKPRFYSPSTAILVKATQPFERLSMDFKGPLPTNSRNRYLLTIIDEYSRFPFAFPCSDMTASTVIKCLTQLFSIFGMPLYIHSDRGSSFMNSEVKSFLLNLGSARAELLHITHKEMDSVRGIMYHLENGHIGSTFKRAAL